MNPAPSENDLTSTAPDWEIWKPRLSLPSWLRDNPGLVLSAVYLLLSAVGLLYQFLFFRRFKLNVLEFSDAADFLMVVVREPLTIAMASLGLFFYWGYMWSSLRVAEWCYRRWPRWRKDPVKLAASREKARKMVPSAQAMFILTYAVLFTLLYSTWQARRARAGDFPRVTVQFKADAVAAAQAAPFEATLLGTTSRFVLLYRPETKRAEALPFDAIAQLSWDARRDQEREADAARAAEKANTPAGAPARP
ncbi:MAG TPA: hypothetical protein VK477_03665 [Acidobacteriota bacterium]|nr:hypothetical protein [Acidobacteriota bacterium]